MTTSDHIGSGLKRRDLLAMAALGAAATQSAAAATPRGELTWAIHVSLAPTWFDPAETQALITPYMMLYALHDAVVKPMPGALQAPSLAESWSASEGCEVLVRTLSRRVSQTDHGSGGIR